MVGSPEVAAADRADSGRSIFIVENPVALLDGILPVGVVLPVILLLARAGSF
jgi:hypothetical protein